MNTATPVRHPAVAGRFYPNDPAILREEVKSYLSQEGSRKRVRALGCVVPHAGYVYSGHVAGAVFSRLEVPELCIILCPNHTGMGRALAIMSEGVWETPLGPVPIDKELADALKRRFPALEEDSVAHHAEHAIEVELPFLQILRPGIKFVPLALGTRHFEVLDELGIAIADVIAEVIAAQSRPILIIASSDMNHYEPDALTRIKDQSAIDPMVALDPRALYDVATLQNISMCGLGPVVTMLTAGKKLGAASAELVKYATSGDISGDRNMVVGYAGVIVR
jgi:AmmeMemoRadiSam system protein B